MESFQEGLQTLSIQLMPFILAVVFHEYAHGFMAHRWGDTTAKDAGRLTLNPVPHLDPIGTLLFPILNMVTGISFMFGWARPVPIDPRRFRKFRPGLFWVSLAGPLMNFLLAIVSAAIFCAIYLWMPQDFYLFDPLHKMAQASVVLNYSLGLFNLIPVPPLDGSKIVESFLPLKLAMRFEAVSRYGFFILLALFMTGAYRFLYYPILLFSNITLTAMALLFGLSSA